MKLHSLNTHFFRGPTVYLHYKGEEENDKKSGTIWLTKVCGIDRNILL